MCKARDIARVTYHHKDQPIPPCCCSKQADLLTKWSARALAQQLGRSTGGCFPGRESQAPFSNLITRLLIPAALNLHGSLPTFSSLFLLQSKRTDKLSGTRDFIVDGWQAASFPHSTTVPCHNAKSTLNLTDSTKLLEFCSTYKQAACFCLCRRRQFCLVTFITCLDFERRLKKKPNQNKTEQIKTERQSTVTKSIALLSMHSSYFIAVLPNYQVLETILITFDKNKSLD